MSHVGRSLAALALAAASPWGRATALVGAASANAAHSSPAAVASPASSAGSNDALGDAPGPAARDARNSALSSNSSSSSSSSSASSADSFASVRVVRAFPQQPRWKRPIWFGCVPRALDAARESAPARDALPPRASAALDAAVPHAVAEQHGVVHVFELDARGQASEPRVWLDIATRTCRIGNEEGLLGLAFDPAFDASGRVFVHYSVRGAQRGRLSEFRLARGAREIDVGSERIVAEIEQPYRNHNGGSIAFGPDACLYWGLGDGGAGGDPQQNGQSLSTWLGKILRIDVLGERSDATAAGYRVPADNPFVAVPDARAEIWALGLRNPWRFAFDARDGSLWCGDVGQDAEEEVDVIVRGGNYGWRVREGKRGFDDTARRGPGELIDPVASYPRTSGWSVTGGCVYRGERVSALRGHYVYGDYVSGRQWALAVDGVAAPNAGSDATAVARAQTTPTPRELPMVESPASYGVDAWGELYVCSFDGRLYRFEADAAGAVK